MPTAAKHGPHVGDDNRDAVAMRFWHDPSQSIDGIESTIAGEACNAG